MYKVLLLLNSDTVEDLMRNFRRWRLNMRQNLYFWMAIFILYCACVIQDWFLCFPLIYSEMIDCAVLMKLHYTTNNCHRERGLSTLRQPALLGYHSPSCCWQWCDLPMNDCVGNTAGYCRLVAHGNPITATLSGNQWNSAFGDYRVFTFESSGVCILSFFCLFCFPTQKNEIKRPSSKWDVKRTVFFHGMVKKWKSVHLPWLILEPSCFSCLTARCWEVKSPTSQVAQDFNRMEKRLLVIQCKLLEMNLIEPAGRQLQYLWKQIQEVKGENS